MPTTCTASGSISAGDAVCVTAWDGVNSRPKVARATAANLATSKTVYGVVKAVGGGGGTADVLVVGEVAVLVAGEVADQSITGLNTGAGTSKVVATDIYNLTVAHQARLIHIDRPNGSEHIVGTSDENGNLAVQPRASRDTSPQHVVNVRAYGAVGDGVKDDAPGFNAAIHATGPGGPYPNSR